MVAGSLERGRPGLRPRELATDRYARQRKDGRRRTLRQPPRQRTGAAAELLEPAERSPMGSRSAGFVLCFCVFTKQPLCAVAFVYDRDLEDVHHFDHEVRRSAAKWRMSDLKDEWTRSALLLFGNHWL